ncbi:MAG: hypothetical protein JST89_13435 [Cyanobacteria bacterium SZAS-4]|nr:hypothetical protein [Cyanobacteria bacterium SZAS-4]
MIVAEESDEWKFDSGNMTPTGKGAPSQKELRELFVATDFLSISMVDFGILSNDGISYAAVITREFAEPPGNGVFYLLNIVDRDAASKARVKATIAIGDRCNIKNFCIEDTHILFDTSSSVSYWNPWALNFTRVSLRLQNQDLSVASVVSINEGE